MKTAFWIAILAVIVVLLPNIIRGFKRASEANNGKTQDKASVPPGDGDAD